MMNSRPVNILVATLFYVSFVFPNITLAADARIESFTPTGVVRGVEQVRARFTEPMVPLGDLRDHLNPFFIECPIKGTPRWLNSKEWVYDFEEKVPAGVECKFGLRRETKTLDKSPILGNTFFSFSSGGPKILRISPYAGAQVDLEQVFILESDGEVDPSSLKKHLRIEVLKTGESLPVRVVGGDTRTKILETQWRYRNKLEDEDLMKRLYLVQATRAFPVETGLNLVWSKKIQSKSKVASDKDQVFKFGSLSDFTVSFSCTRENADANCSPLTNFHINFNRPVAWKWAKQISIKQIDGKELKLGTTPPKQAVEDTATFTNIYFSGPVAAGSEFEINVPKELVDDRGDKPINLDRYPLTFKTAELPPLAKFAARFGIIESKTEALLPVTLRNLESDVEAEIMRLGGKLERSAKIAKISGNDIPDILSWFTHLSNSDWNRNESIFEKIRTDAEEMEIPRKEDAKEFEVVGIPLKNPGLYVVEIESENLRGLLNKNEKEKRDRFYVPAMALVTNMAVHFKHGIENSLVWVTSLDAAAPVEAAKIQVFNCQGDELWSGTTNKDGIAEINQEFSEEQVTYCRGSESGLIVAATKEDDFSFVISSWNDGIERYRFSLPWSRYETERAAHTAFGRTLVRAGETLHMKHFLREKVLNGFGRLKEFPVSLEIEHLGTNKKVLLPLKWDAKAGTTLSEWKIPKTAHLGHYNTYFIFKGKNGDRVQSGSFQVEEFRVPLLKGRIQTTETGILAGKSIPVDFSVEYLNGGAAQNLDVRIRHRVSGSSVRFSEFEGFSFADKPLVEGVRTDADINTVRNELHVVDGNLTKTGDLRMALQPKAEENTASSFQVEMEFRDPNGTSQTVSRSFSIYPAKELVGIKTSSWIMKAKEISAEIAVADTDGKAVQNAVVTVNLYERENYSHRKRLVGGFYAYENINQVRLVAKDVCKGKTNSKGLLECKFQSPESGNFILQATRKSPEGNSSFASTSVWVPGKDAWWFSQDDHDRMDLIPEREEYQPGETARFQVRMPFTKATALIAVEREGILETRIAELSAKEPVIEIPVQRSFAPNMFVSVLAVRGRTGDPKPTATIDLGKPAFKLGIANIKVGWDRHRLQVKVKPKAETYKVRDTASALVQVRSDKGKPVAGADIMFAVVDKGLLQLKPNESWKILDKMMRTRGYGVRNSTASMHVVGKRHFGLKAVVQGGGGGQQTTRELFDSLVYWSGSTKTNKKGEATISFKLNDSLTSHELVAVVNAGVQRFGTGSSSIKVIQDIGIMPGVSPIARSGDEVKTLASVRNMSNKSQKFKLYARMKFGSEKWQEFKTRNLSLKSGASSEQNWLVKIPHGYEGVVQYEFMAKVGKRLLDRVKVRQKVIPAIRSQIQQATIEQVSGSISQKIDFPKDGLPHGNAINLHMSRSLGAGLKSVVDYMENYPHTCLEQRISRAIARGRKDEWQAIMGELGSYQAPSGLVSYFPPQSRWRHMGSAILTAYILQMSHHSQWDIPADRRQKMLNALDQFVQGKLSSMVYYPAADLDMRRVIAYAAYSKFMSPRQLVIDELKGDFTLWPTSTLLYWWEILQKAPKSESLSNQIREIETLVKSRLDTQGTIVNFRKDSETILWWLMETGAIDIARLLLNFQDQETWRPLMARVVQGLFARQKQGHWRTSIANAWGVLAVQAFVKNWESAPVKGNLVAKFGKEEKKLDWETKAATDSKAGSKGSTQMTREFSERLQVKSLRFSGKDLPSSGDLTIQQQGSGKPWAFIQTASAIPLKGPISAGLVIERDVKPIEQKESGLWNRGDIFQVTIRVTTRSDQAWVVVEDPIPGGASIIGSVGQNSMASVGDEKKSSRNYWSMQAYPRFIERGQDFYRAYYAFVPKGVFELSYRVRLNNSGLFRLPATRAEVMYNPEVFAAIPNSDLEVE